MKKLFHMILSGALSAQLGFLPHLATATEAQDQKAKQMEQMKNDLQKLEGLMMNENYWKSLSDQMKKDGVRMGNERGEEESYLRIVKEGDPKKKVFSVLLENGLWIKSTLSISPESFKIVSQILDKNRPNKVLDSSAMIVKAGSTQESIEKRRLVYQYQLEKNIKKQWNEKYSQNSSSLMGMVASYFLGTKSAHAGVNIKKIMGWIGVVVGASFMLVSTYFLGTVGLNYFNHFFIGKPVGDSMMMGSGGHIILIVVALASTVFLVLGHWMYSAGRKAVGNPKYLPSISWFHIKNWKN